MNGVFQLIGGSVAANPVELDLNTLFPFPLDEFQHQAIAALNRGKSVVVCVPTGSGKTLIGEYAIHRALTKGGRVFYTTPLKALSNQKFRDFRLQFGSEQVGLLTGDLSINRDASVVVMTTEIFRNMLYGTPIGQLGTSLLNLEAVVLDECHYMNDRQRGTVWEESIIYCPKEVQLVALSATVANGQQLTDWISQVHGTTELIYSSFRPIPLKFYFCNFKGLFPLLDEEGKTIHPQLKSKLGRSHHPSSRSLRQEAPSLGFTLAQLWQRDMLPVIYFIFSRRGCDRAVADMGTLSLVNELEAFQLNQHINAFLERFPELRTSNQIEPLRRGIAAHHAGILPAWKGLVEELFQQGLVKVVFATETLAAGINMPARTTVISSLSKRTDLGHRLLTPSEFLQMAGRAGRRGMDKVGHVVTVQTAFEGAKEAGYLSTAGADPLVSQFSPSYGMVLNLLQIHTLEKAQELVESSFGQYLSTLNLHPQRVAIADLETQLHRMQTQSVGVDWGLLDSYETIYYQLKEEKRHLKSLQQKADLAVSSELTIALKFAVAGSILSLKGKNAPFQSPMPAVLVAKFSGSGQAPSLICLTHTNRWHVITANDVVALHGDLPRIATVDHLTVPPELTLKPGCHKSGQEESLVISQQLNAIADRQVLTVSRRDLTAEVQKQREQVMTIEEQLLSHPVHQWSDRVGLCKRRKRITAMEEELHDRQTKLDQYAHRHWHEFQQLIKLLTHFDCLNPQMKPTQLGEVAAAIRGDNELWLGLALASGQLDRLAPHHLASAAAALTTEVSRPDLWTNYHASEEVETALHRLRTLRQQLFQQQRRCQVSLPIWLEYDLIGVVEQWALGIEWSMLCANTSLDEGDLVRILRRTVDFLSQIPHIPHISITLHHSARQAIQLMDRFPVNEIVD
jgi:superfamily II RNA helicase